jgi:hypothetical protein
MNPGKDFGVNVGVNAGTRNHKGAFVRHTVYKLIEVDQNGWALICQDKASCHYVDPDALREVQHTTDE